MERICTCVTAEDFEVMRPAMDALPLSDRADLYHTWDRYRRVRLAEQRRPETRP